MINLKYGQEFVLAEDFKTQEVFSEKVVVIPKGTKGFVTGSEFVKLLDGPCMNKEIMLSNNDFHVEGYDTKNIAKMIYNRLRIEFGIDECMSGYDLKPSDIIGEIEDVLEEILN